MYRKIFPSYDWDDVWYVNQIVNLPEVTSCTAAGFVKNVPNEEVKSSDAAIKRWIDDNMNGCSCLVLFWGEKTYESRWVDIFMPQRLIGIWIENACRYAKR